MRSAPDGRSRITVPSRLVKRQATRLYGVPPSRIDVIEPPIEGERFARIGPVDVEARERDLGIPRDAVVCCFVGMNYRRKGLPTLLAAMERLDPRYHLLIVGRDRRSWTFRWRARRGALAGRVHFLGKTDSIDAVLGHSDVLVLPSLYEPFGLVVTEAMAASRPVVASASTGASELVRDGESGFVLRDARDPDELAKRLAQLDDRDVREAMGREAARAVGGLTPERHLERILEVYERVRRERSCRDDVQGRTHEVKSVGAVQTVAELAPRLEAENVRDYEALAALPVERTLHAVRPERRTELVRLGDLRAVRKLYAGDPRGGAGEWRALLDLAAAGLAGPPPLAFASGPGGSAVLMGFVEGEEQLDHWSVDQLAKLAPPEARHLKRRVIRALADHVRAFHGRGFTHRDLYLGHVWVRESDLHLRFMDLHRVEQRTPPPRRRVVKDLAALHFSALHHVRPTRQDQLRFFKRYLRRGGALARAATAGEGRAAQECAHRAPSRGPPGLGQTSKPSSSSAPRNARWPIVHMRGSSAEFASQADARHSAHTRARSQVASSGTPAATRKASCCARGNRNHATERSVAGSPAVRSPKSITAERRPSCISRFIG